MPRRGARWRARQSALALLGAMLLAAAPAAAWNATGHVLIALLAYDALAPPQRLALVELLKAHPRFADDIAPALPASLPSGERDRWSFALAATWPDLARSEPAYDHPSWHYVNLPLSLRHGALVSCARARRELPESLRRLARLDAERRARGLAGIASGDSIREALPQNLRTLADASRPREQRALSLSWVLHLVGDAHQPLHAVALFTSQRFVSGDRGGNDILVPERGPLHRVWDELLGLELTPDAIAAGSRWLASGASPVRAGDVPRDIGAWVDRWLDEDCELARTAVYAPMVLRSVERFEASPASVPVAAPSAAAGAPPAPGPPGPPGPPGAAPSTAPPLAPKPQVSVGPEYLQRARERARERARIAAARLTALLATLRF